MFVDNLNPILLTIGPLSIRWYGLMYVLAFIIGYFYIYNFSKYHDLVLEKDQVMDLLFYQAIFMLIFSRIVEVFYYNPTYYYYHLSKVFAIWEGGLSFHGGLIGFIVGTYIFCKLNNKSFLKIADVVSIPAALGLMFGRIGNFINGELVGRVTSVPWCVRFPKYDDLCRHPSQLYESFKNLFMFGILIYFRNKKVPSGFLFSLLLIMYSILRSIIEQWFREPQGYVMGLTQGQFLNIFLFFAGIGFMYYSYKKNY